MAVRRYMPASIPQLVVAGFSLVALPLIAALIFALFKVDGLARQSRDVVFGAVQAVQAGRTLVEQATAMERSVRQYQVLEDDALYQRYLAQRQEFAAALAGLLAYSSDTERRVELDRLTSDEAQLNKDLLALRQQHKLPDERLLAQFSQIESQAREILVEGVQLATNEANALKRSTARAKQLILWLAAMLLPFTVAVAGLFIRVITRPLKQIDQAIRALGNVQFGAPIKVNGPGDLQELGVRLEWLRQRLVELEQQKLDFLRHVSHDLKTPLAAIREGADLLHDRVLGGLSGEQTEVVQILKSNSVELQRQIEDLLRFKLPKPGAMPLGVPVAAKDLAETVIAAHALALRAKNVRVEAKLQNACALGDREQIRIIFDNLLSNAVKYSPENGCIRIHLWAGTGRVWFEILDQGPGIAVGEREKVFEAFYQSGASQPSRIKGTGLGLAIVKEYTRLNRGSVEILDSAVGARLRIVLPLCPVGRIVAATV